MKQEYYYQHMNKAEQSVYRAMLAGFEMISPEFPVLRLDGRICRICSSGFVWTTRLFFMWRDSVTVIRNIRIMSSSYPNICLRRKRLRK